MRCAAIPFLKNAHCPEGGTAANLFIFDVPRLSIDIDLNTSARLTARRCSRAAPSSSEPSKPCAVARD